MPNPYKIKELIFGIKFLTGINPYNVVIQNNVRSCETLQVKRYKYMAHKSAINRLFIL